MINILSLNYFRSLFHLCFSVLIIQAATNVRSAMVSSLEPNSLAVFVFLAIVPSIIAVNPAAKYKT